MSISASKKRKVLNQVLKEGKTVSEACREAGIARKTFYEWKKRYLGTPNRIKKSALKPKYLFGKAHPRNKRAQYKDRVISIIVSNPSWGSRKISAKLCKHSYKLSNHAVFSLLKDLHLETKEKREEFSSLYQTFAKIEKIYQPKPLRLIPEARKRVIEEVVIGETSVTQVCQKYHLSRKTFYKWLARYQEAKEKEAVLLEAMGDNYTKGFAHPRSVSETVQEEILKIVKQYPQYSSHKVAQILAEVGNHGVQNVFARLNLNTYEKRLSYAQAYQPVAVPVSGALDRLKPILGRIPIISAIPPPAREKITLVLRPFAFSLISSVVFSTIFIYWLSILAQAPSIGAKLGLFFASIALLTGSFFFAYSMKYYLTLAIVLSFSRQSAEGGGGYAFGLNGQLDNRRKENGSQSWLKRIFGIDNGSISPEKGRGSNLIQAGGLQPSLDHIKLKRYPFVSIHLPFYNEKKVAERILSACTSIDYPNYEIIVCDDSTDETVQIVQRYAKEHNKAHPRGPKIKILHRPTREGFKGAALSFAVKNMDPRTEFCVVFDADFIPYPDTLEMFVKYFKANNKDSENYTKNNIAVVGGYQWHVLNKSENWITRGVRTEYAGSYVIERPGREILGLLKQISGSVYMIRADVLKKVGWGTSITEDFQLTLKLYEQGYKVVYTPYVQAPSECVSTLKRLIRQRMRWSEGHSHCIRQMFVRLMKSPKLTFLEKLEVLYISPYYLQAAFFLVGTFCWLLAETVFRARLPFWTSLWGWSLVLTNFFALPLVNAVGLFLEEAEEKDYLGILSFIALSYIVVPFQAYASVKGFLEKEEGTWFRTPKSGKITDIFTRGKFYRWIAGILPGKRGVPAVASVPVEDKLAWLGNSHVALVTANNRFDSFSIKPKRYRFVGNLVLIFALVSSFALSYFGTNVKTGLLSDLPIQTRVERVGEDSSFLSRASKIFSPKEVLAATEKAPGMVISGVKQVPTETLMASLILILFITTAFFIHLYKRKRRFFKKAVKTILVFTLVFSWLLASWPRIWNNPKFPPEIKVAQAAISLGATITNAIDTTAISYSANHTCDANTKALVVVAMGYDSVNADAVVSKVTFNGIALTQVVYYRNTADADDAFVSVWYLKNPEVGTERSILVTQAGSCTDVSFTAVNLVTDASADTIVLDSTDAGSTSATTSHTSTVNPAKTGSISIGGIVNADAATTDVGITTGTLIAGSGADYGQQTAKAAWVAEGSGVATIVWSKVTTSDSWACSATFYEQFYPTLALGTPAHNATGVSLTPDLTFTGTDAVHAEEIEYQVQVDTVTTFDSQGGIFTEDSYSETNQNISYGTTILNYRGQSFLSSIGGNLDNAKFYLFKEGSPTGNVVAELWSIDNDELGFGNLPVAVLATSDSIDVSTIDASYELVEFTFSGDEKYTLVDGIAYVIILHFDYTFVNSTNEINVGANSTAHAHQGDNYFYEVTWAVGSNAVCFYVQSGSFYPLLDKLSETPDATFAGTGDPHPWPSGNVITYTVQAGDTLDPSTDYYWRVKGIDPDGSNTWGAWSTAFKFTTAPTFEQSAYRWFQNDNSTSVGPFIVDQDTKMTSDQTPAQETAFRLRILIHVGNSALASSGQDFKLQIAAKVGVDCDLNMATTNESYADLVTASGAIRYYNNTTPADNAALTADVVNDPVHDGHTNVTQTYKDLDGSDGNINFTNSVGEVPVDQDGEWDFAIVDNSAAESITYCLRITEADGTVLDTYSVVPEFTTVPENPLLLFGLYPLVVGFLKKLRRKK